MKKYSKFREAEVMSLPLRSVLVKQGMKAEETKRYYTLIENVKVLQNVETQNAIEAEEMAKNCILGDENVSCIKEKLHHRGLYTRGLCYRFKKYEKEIEERERKFKESEKEISFYRKELQELKKRNTRLDVELKLLGYRKEERR